MSDDDNPPLDQPQFPDLRVPAIFIEDISAVSSNSDLARFYLLREEPAIQDDYTEQKTVPVGQIITSKRSFAIITLQLVATLFGMLRDGKFSSEEAAAIRKGLEEASSDLDNEPS